MLYRVHHRLHLHISMTSVSPVPHEVQFGSACGYRSQDLEIHNVRAVSENNNITSQCHFTRHGLVHSNFKGLFETIQGSTRCLAHNIFQSMLLLKSPNVP